VIQIVSVDATECGDDTSPAKVVISCTLEQARVFAQYMFIEDLTIALVNGEEEHWVGNLEDIAKKERARIVAWLRARVDSIGDSLPMAVAKAWGRVAVELIEKGEHLK